MQLSTARQRVLIALSALALLGSTACGSQTNQGGAETRVNAQQPGGQAASPVAIAPGSASPGIAVASPSPGSAVTVDLTSASRFEPATVTIQRGATVTWRNSGGGTHTVTSDPAKARNAADAAMPSGAQAWDSGNLTAGQTYSQTFTIPGTYKYFCAIHETSGMVGTVVVNP